MKPGSGANAIIELEPSLEPVCAIRASFLPRPGYQTLVRELPSKAWFQEGPQAGLWLDSVLFLSCQR